MSARVSYIYDGSPLNFNFPSFDKSHIKVSVNEVLISTFTISNYSTGLTENRISSGGGGTITFSPDINVGDTVTIFRETPSDIFVTFQDGATLTASELNLNNTAHFFRTDEVVLSAGALSGPPGPAGTVSVSPTTTTGNPGTDASVTNTGSPSAAVLAFTIPRGDPGTPATITSVTAVSGPTAGVTLGGTPSARTIEFTLQKGDQGTGFTIKGSLTHTGQPTSTEAPSPVVGDLWIDSDGDGYLYNQANQWQNVGAIRGPQGPIGDGFTGGSYNPSTGVVTFTSADGLGFSTGDLRGQPGVGSPGTAATIQAGTVTYGSPAAVNNSGTSSAAVFDFTLPQLWTDDGANSPVSNIYYPNNVAIGSNSTNTDYRLFVNGNANVNGALSASSLSGNGSNVSNVNAVSLGGSSLSDILNNSSGSISVGSTRPSNPSVGDLWWNTETFRLYVLYEDEHWVDANPAGPGIAPNLTIGTVRTGPAFATIEGTSPNYRLNLDIPEGERGLDGASVVSASINANNRLIINKSDGSSIDAGAIPPATFTGGNVPNLTSFSGQAGPDNVAVNMSGSMVFYASNNAQLIGTDTFTIKGNSGIHLYAAGVKALEIKTNKVTSNLDLDVNGIVKSTRTANDGSAFVGTSNCILSAESGNLIFRRDSQDVGTVDANDWKIYRELEVDGIIRSTRSVGSGSAFVGNDNCILSAEGGNLIFMRQGTTVATVDGNNWRFNSEVRAANLPTSPKAANVYATTDGKLRRSSSSRRYKNTIEDYDADSAYKFLADARPVTFFSNNVEETEQFIGFIAEEMDEVEPRYVHYNEDGEPDGVQYSSIVTTLTKICQMQEQRIKALEDRLNG